MRILLVSHFHWDREWYRTFDGYRGRLVDAIDRVLELLAADPGYRFMLDGQAVVLEDYLAVRPESREPLADALRAGRLSTGPWYVQPDMLLPSGEALVRNLLYGRRVAAALGPVSTVAYVPDSFGHPAQAPQLFAGFGLAPFVYWRGNGDELDRLGHRYRWVAPDGSAVRAVLLPDGYFNAACLPADPREAARRLAERLPESGDDVLLMNGIDHMLPDPHTGAVAAALAEGTGARVERTLLETGLAREAAGLPEHRGELAGARLANLLPGVWSTRMPLKLENRRCETLLGGWVEPWAALGLAHGLADERPSLQRAWREVLRNQAHDSICGCSIDAVADAVTARFAAAAGLAEQTLQRLLERFAGRGLERRTPATLELDVVVFNPSPHPRSDRVRVALDAYPALSLPLGVPELAPLVLAATGPIGFSVDGDPGRVVVSDDPQRTRWLPHQQALDLEFVARDVPAFGCRRFRLTPREPAADAVDAGRTIAADALRVDAADDGRLSISNATHAFAELFGVEDRGDRGDTYDFDPVDDDPGARLREVACQRQQHASGIATLTVTRVFDVPRSLNADRTGRSAETIPLTLVTEATIAPGVDGVEVRVRVDGAARDHRLRLLFPTGRPAAHCRAAVTFDVAERPTAPVDDRTWVHPAPTTFAHHGWVEANGLCVVAPGLPEAEVDPSGTIAITLRRAVGWLARFDLRRRPLPAGPAMPADGAQLPAPLRARFVLLPGAAPWQAGAAELGLRAVLGGPTPPLPAGQPLLQLAPQGLILSALKPAEDGDGIVVRVLNPTDAPQRAVLRLGFACAEARAVRLDESPAPDALEAGPGEVRFDVPARALRSLRLAQFR